MNVYKWVAVSILVLELLVYISRIGKPREPVTPGEAVAGVIEYGALVALVVLA